MWTEEKLLNGRMFDPGTIRVVTLRSCSSRKRGDACECSTLSISQGGRTTVEANGFKLLKLHGTARSQSGRDSAIPVWVMKHVLMRRLAGMFS